MKAQLKKSIAFLGITLIVFASWGQPQHLIIVDSGFPNYKSIKASFPASFPVIEITDQNDWTDINDWVSMHPDIENVHLFIPSNTTGIIFGSSSLSKVDKLSTSKLNRIKSALSERSSIQFMLYSCEYTSTANGQQFIQDFANALGVYINASSSCLEQDEEFTFDLKSDPTSVPYNLFQ